MTHYKGSAILSRTKQNADKYGKLNFGIGAHRCITGGKLVKIKPQLVLVVTH